MVEFEKIWNQYRTSITALVRSRVSDRADADDLVQEVLVRTHQNLDTVRTSESLQSWLFQLTRNAITDYYRKKARRREDAVAAPEPVQEEDDDHARLVLAQCVLPFIESLPEEARSVLIAIDIEGRSQKDYAEEHGLRYSTVKSRVQRSRLLLRQAFEDCCVFSRDARGAVSDFSPRVDCCEDG